MNASSSSSSSHTAPLAVQRFLARWQMAERWVAVLAFTGIGALIFADVAGREFIGPLADALGIETGATGVYGARKISLHLLVIGAFAGLGVSVATGTQIVPRVAFGWVPAAWEAAVTRLGNLVSAAFLGAVTYYAVVFVASSREIGTVIPGLDWPAWIIQSFMAIGFASAALRYLAFAIWPGVAPQLEEIPE